MSELTPADVIFNGRMASLFLTRDAPLFPSEYEEYVLVVILGALFTASERA